jgi:hypothetical protein
MERLGVVDPILSDRDKNQVSTLSDYIKLYSVFKKMRKIIIISSSGLVSSS